MPESLPLFPLGTVLFPGLVLPLHVFEERYRVMVGELLAQPEGSRRFGVVAIKQGHEVGVDGARALYEVGCTAEVQRVETYDDGRYDVVATGATRFRLLEVDASRPYLTGAVELLPDTLGDPSSAEVLAAAVRSAFGTYVRALSSARQTEVEVPALPSEPQLLSYLIAAAVVVDLPTRQGLLAELDAAARLRAELTLLRREATLLRAVPAAPAPELTRMPFNPN